MANEINNKVTEAIRSRAGKSTNEKLAEQKKQWSPLFVMLNWPEITDRREADNEIKEQSARLMRVLADFKLNAKIVNVSRGPSVSRFELELGSGTTVSYVAGLTEDVAVRLGVPGIRVEAPVPGKAVIGLEVPNIKRCQVSLLEMVRCDEVRNNTSKLCVGLGRDTEGKIVSINLAEMPHLLAVGMRASDIISFLDTVLAGLLFKAIPDEVKLLIVDNMAERLDRYNKIPHLFRAVITNTKEAVSSLEWAVDVMKTRYRRFTDRRVCNIESYNAVATKKLPYIVIVVSELYWLMKEVRTEVEELIYALSQKAAACGIHMVLATQSLSADVITDIIRMSIPSRIAFVVSSREDSRTVLYRSGAEKLLGKGDMLYYPADAMNPLRVQGPTVSDEEMSLVLKVE